MPEVADKVSNFEEQPEAETAEMEVAEFPPEEEGEVVQDEHQVPNADQEDIEAEQDGPEFSQLSPSQAADGHETTPPESDGRLGFRYRPRSYALDSTPDPVVDMLHSLQILIRRPCWEVDKKRTNAEGNGKGDRLRSQHLAC